jgi:hypothetical protein
LSHPAAVPALVPKHLARAAFGRPLLVIGRSLYLRAGPPEPPRLYISGKVNARNRALDFVHPDVPWLKREVLLSKVTRSAGHH